MTTLLVLLCIALIVIVAVQIGRVTELAAKLRGEEEMEDINNKRNSRGMLIFLIGFLVACVVSAFYYQNWMLGYGPHESASEHGKLLDSLFNVTLVVTGIVFIATHIALFYFSYKYRAEKGRKAIFLSHNNTVELIWTGIPAVVMAFLVIKGLDVWNEVMADVGSNEEYMEIEATGYQFAWIVRHPGDDGVIGEKNFREITGTNPLGQVWDDRANLDDIHVDEIVLPKGKKVRVRITARDVLHNFYLPHFRVKMDAVPGMPTYFVFTPDKTTDEYRQELRKYPEYNTPDPDDSEKMLWETFDYELACAELCGTGHFSMRKSLRIVEQEEYDQWLTEQTSFYMAAIRNTADDPLINELLPIEISERRQSFNDEFERILTLPDTVVASDRVMTLDNVKFAIGSTDLTPLSRYEIDNLAEALNSNVDVRIELSGHTDNTGDPAANQTLSQQRAEVVVTRLLDKGIDPARLLARGYGQDRPKEANDTEEGRAANRRTEITILEN